MPKLTAEQSYVRIEGEAAELQIQAAEAGEGGKPRVRKFSMVAYTGGAMQLAGYYHPLVVDLEGMTVRSQKRPILFSHEVDRIVGHSEKIEVTAQRIRVDGLMSGTGPDKQHVEATADNGFPWQSSIGAEVKKVEFVDAGQSAKVNGRVFNGPLYVARKTSLREVSFAALGADDNTSSSVAAVHSQEDAVMTFSQWLKAKGIDESTLSAEGKTSLKAMFDAEQKPQGGGVVSASGTNPPPAVTATGPTFNADEYREKMRKVEAEESARINGIRAAVKKYKVERVKIDDKEVDLEAHAIDAGWSVDKVELTALRAARPSAPAIHMAPDIDATAGVLQCALAQTLKLANHEKEYDDKTLSASRKLFRHGIGLQQLLIIHAEAAGYRCPSGPMRSVSRDFLQAAFSSADISGILSTTQNKILLQSFMAVEQTWRKITTIRPVNDFKTITSYRLLDDAKFEKVTPSGELKHGSLSEESFTNKADTYGKLLVVSREDIINDDLGALTNRGQKLGRGAALKLNDVFWTEFLSNGGTFWTTARLNYFEGAGTTLQHSQLKVAEQMFLDQLDPMGEPLGIAPKILLVPTALSATARELMASTHIVTGNTANIPSKNIFENMFDVAVSAYLSKTSIGGVTVTGSSTAWYVLANPLDLATIETVFLNGQETPTIETVEVAYDILGFAMRGYFDFGCNQQEYRAGVKSKGAA